MAQPELRKTPAPARQTAPTAFGEAPNAAPALIEWARNLGIATAAGAFLAFVGALDTGQMPLAQRLLYWVPVITVGGVFGRGMALLVSRLAPQTQANPWVFGILLALAISAPASVGVWGYTNLIFNAHMPARALPVFYASVLVISAAMTAIMIAVSWPGRRTFAPPGGAAPAQVRFLDRLPGKLKGAEIYAVSAEDHYLRVHTSKGGDLILMRLSDAIAELEGLEGAQTHRSWWVARTAIESARRDGDKVALVLKGGAEAPVSRPNIKPLRDAGWF